jgi:hypothetical protein
MLPAPTSARAYELLAFCITERVGYFAPVSIGSPNVLSGRADEAAPGEISPLALYSSSRLQFLGRPPETYPNGVGLQSGSRSYRLDADEFDLSLFSGAGCLTLAIGGIFCAISPFTSPGKPAAALCLMVFGARGIAGPTFSGCESWVAAGWCRPVVGVAAFPPG